MEQRNNFESLGMKVQFAVARLASLPLECMHTVYPNRLSQTLTSPEDLKQPPGTGCIKGHLCKILLLRFILDPLILYLDTFILRPP